MNQSSVINYRINEVTGVKDTVNDIVCYIFMNHPAGLTTNELINNYLTHVDKLPAISVKEKTFISSKSQGLKAVRTDLTHRGILKLMGTRICSISNRPVEYFIYIGQELSKLEQLKAELKRRQSDLTNIQNKIYQLENRIKDFE